MEIRNTLAPDFTESFKAIIRRYQFKGIATLGREKPSGDDLTARTLVKQLLQQYNPARAPNLATSIRNITEPALFKYMSISSSWGYDKTMVRRVRAVIAAHSELAILFSFSGNGYVRQRAIYDMQRINSAFEFSLLLIRLNDWVEAVRITAREKIKGPS